LKDAETGQRGYIITGKENYLEPFQLANEHTGERMERLKQLTENNSRHLERIAAAEPLIKTKFDLMNQTINLRRNSGFEAAQRVVMTNQGKNTMDAIRVLFGAMKDDETALLQNLKVTSETKVRQVIITFVVMFLYFVWFIFWSNETLAHEIF
jgi:CHASE3 domain sensor protein